MEEFKEQAAKKEEVLSGNRTEVDYQITVSSSCNLASDKWLVEMRMGTPIDSLDARVARTAGQTGDGSKT